EGEILVIALDGKGVPMVKAAQPKRPRRYVGEKANKKRMAVVSAVYTVHPHMRTAEEIVTSLFGEAPPDARVDRVEPCNKHVRATLFNLDEAVAKVMRIARERDPEDEKTRVVLIDGERRLVNREEFKGWIQILDIFHVMEKLWEAGIALYGQRSSVAEN